MELEVSGVKTIRMTSDLNDASLRRFKLLKGDATGHTINITFFGSNTARYTKDHNTSGGTVARLSSTWEGTDYGTLTVVFDNEKNAWLDTARSTY